MRKIMKNKVNVFGKTVPVFVLVLLGIGLVSAALVTYLSGMVTGNVSVESPMVAGISLGLESWSTTQCWRADQELYVNSFPECELEEIDQDDCFCGECPSFDEFNSTCWAFNGRFGESIGSEDIVCDWGFRRYFDPKTKVVW